MVTNYDRLKKNIVTLHGNGADVKILTVEELVKYLNQTPQILDKTEKRYIRNIVAPFWKLVKYVRKESDGSGKHYYIVIAYDEAMYANSTTHLYLPSFDIDSEMYVNMEVDKRYTLEELDIKFE